MILHLKPSLMWCMLFVGNTNLTNMTELGDLTLGYHCRRNTWTMCEFHESTCNGFGDIWWTDNPIYFINVRSPNSVIFVRFMFPTKSMHHVRLGFRCNIIE